MFGPVFRLIGAYEASVKQYPNIRPGEDFKGYGVERQKAPEHEPQPKF
jgi:hypothetical protein